MPFSAYHSRDVQHDLVERLLAREHRRQQDAVVVRMRLGAEHRDVVGVRRELQELLERAHAGHAVADDDEPRLAGVGVAARVHCAAALAITPPLDVRLPPVQELEHRGPVVVVLRVLGELDAVARARQVDRHDLADRRRRAVGHHHDAVGRAAPPRRRRASPSAPCCRSPRRSS